MAGKQKLELIWIGKDIQPVRRPPILLEELMKPFLAQGHQLISWREIKQSEPDISRKWSNMLSLGPKMIMGKRLSAHKVQQQRANYVPIQPY